MNQLLGFKWNSIYARLFTTYLLLTALATSLMSGYILRSFYAYFMQTRQTDLENWTAALSESFADALEENDLDRVKLITARYGAPETVTLRIFNSQGQLLSTSNPDVDRRVTNWLQVPGMKEALAKQAASGIAKGVLTGEDRLYISRPIIRNEQFLGVLRMSMTLAQFQRQFASVISTILISLVFTILIFALFSDRLARSLSRPIEIMRNFAIRLGSGQFGDRLNLRQNNELDQLVIELNRMSERLASLDQERRAFLANVSHEFRTPVSNVLVTVEALRRGAAEDEQLRDRFLQTVEDETKRLARLIHDLLDLGRLEAGVAALEPQQISLRHLIDRAVTAIELRMQGAGITVRQTVTDVQLSGDPERLLQALFNLLDNAIKHSPKGSTVAILTYRSGKRAIIQIRDRGKGIAEADLPRIFEQFYTADTSRQGNGTGLGLAIAKRIIEAHNGSITVSSQIGQGTIFKIILPLGL